MADFLTASGTTTCIEELIHKATDRLVLISPYLKWSQILFERLQGADRRGVRIVMVFGGEDVRVAVWGGSRRTESPTSDAATGYCIRCRQPIRRDKERPLCFECFQVWAEWENWDFEEKYCHLCGAAKATSRRRPLCDACFAQ